LPETRVIELTVGWPVQIGADMENGRGWRTVQRLAAIVVALLTFGNALLLFFIGAIGPVTEYVQSLTFGAGLANLGASVLLVLGATDLRFQRWSRWMFPLAAGALLQAAALMLGIVRYYWGKPQAEDYLFEALVCTLFAFLTPWWGRLR
jgi:hypothetical protein